MGEAMLLLQSQQQLQQMQQMQQMQQQQRQQIQQQMQQQQQQMQQMQLQQQQIQQTPDRLGSGPMEIDPFSTTLFLLVPVLFVVIGLLLASIPAFIAKTKGNTSFGMWLFYGFFLFPVALIHSFLLRSDKKKLEAGTHCQCPNCLELVTITATVCHHCGDNVPIECPGCNKQINSTAKYCRYCGHPVTLTSTESPEKRGRYMRHPSESMLGGVCGGIADRTGRSVRTVRLLTVLATWLTGGLALYVYIGLWLFWPVGTKEHGQVDMSLV